MRKIKIANTDLCVPQIALGCMRINSKSREEANFMRKIKIANTDLCVPQIALGCMRINSKSREEAKRFVDTALELGLNFFDHADIYGKGECEKIFADVIGMSPSIREKIILQSKCGIRPGFFDFSKEHILNSVDGILSRLNTDYLDILLLHRPISIKHRVS